MDTGTDSGRVVEANVVGGEDDGTTLRHILKAELGVIVKRSEIPRRKHAYEFVKLWVWNGAV
jgi:hypothetical protein